MFWLIILTIIAVFILSGINILKKNKEYNFKSTASTLSLTVDAVSKQMRIGFLRTTLL